MIHQHSVTKFGETLPHIIITVLCLPHTALKKVVQGYLSVGLGRKTNLSQKVEKRSRYGILSLKEIVGIRDIRGGGGGGRGMST